MIPAHSQDDTYEDAFSRPGRWLRRLGRPISWRVRGWLGLPRTILVELRWRLGDELMALPVLAALRARYPNDRIILWTNYPELLGLAALADALNANPPRVDRYLLLRGAPRLVPRQVHLAARAGLRPMKNLPPLAPGRPSSRIESVLPANAAPFIALAPGASWPNKRWTPASWQELARTLAARGWPVVVLGAASDPTIPEIPSLLGETSVLEVAQVLDRATLLVSCDSGLMHLSLAMGTPVVALFGPTDPDYLTDSPLLVPVRSTLSCSGFWNRAPEAPAPGICRCGEVTCLHAITPESVASKVFAVLGTAKNPETI